MLRALASLLLLLAVCTARAEDFLDPEVAFRSAARALDARTVEIAVDSAPGYYLYRGRFRFAVAEGGARLGEPRFPPGELHEDPYMGRQEVYEGALRIRVPVDGLPADGGPLALQMTLQGCASAGFCYPPQPRVLRVDMPPGAAADATRPAGADGSLQPRAPAPAPAGDETSRIASTLGSSGLLANLAFFFLAGLGLSLTPCVLPMIPILSGIIVGQGNVSRARGFALSAAYVAGMALTYSAAGVAAGLGGTLVSGALQTPWVLGAFAAVFVLLSLSMFGFYELQMPSAIQTRLSGGAGALRGGRLAGVFLMGALSALIVGPCVAAPLAGALLYIGQTGNAVLGGVVLFAMALGMGVPLLLVGLSAGSLLPRAGAWMEGVKKVFGVLLLATAIWLVSPVLPPVASMLAWALLLIVPAVYLHALDPLPPAASGWRRLWKGCGLVMLLTGAAVLVGALGGNRDPLQPLQFARASQAAGAPGPVFERVRTLAELESRIAASTVPVMLDVYADWCTACKEMEHVTFADPAVRARLAGLRLLQADVTANTEEDRALLQRFGLYGPPGIAFFAPGGMELAHLRLVGFKDPEGFLSHIRDLL